MTPTRLLPTLLLLACTTTCTAAADEEEGHSTLLLYKKMDPMDGFAIGDPINITIAVFNKGQCACIREFRWQ